MIWPGDTEPTIRPEFTQNSAMSHQVAAGTVIITDDGPCNSPSVGRVFDSAPATPVQPSDNTCTQAIIEITSGPDEGRRTMLLLAGTPGDPTLAQGDAITLQLTTTSDGTNGYSFLDYQRTVPLAWWVIVTLVAVVAVGGFVGFRSIIGLLVTLAVVGFVLLPGLLRGGDPLILATVCGSAALFLALYLVHGVTWKTSSALAGTLIALFLATWLARIGIEGIRLRGLGSEDNLLIQLYLPDVTVQGLMLAGFIIGSLGVLNDVTISQASTVNELAHLDPKATPLRLFTGAIRVGRDHIASIMYTLVLGYTGAAIPLLLLLSAADRPLGQVLTSDIMATEILRSAVGALALTLAVPITTLIAAFTAVTGPGDSHDHSHGHS
ncbi:YibE/F family protein [Corynebacterium sp. CCM 8862]|uniref:YibE/F family protein n=2 Tax=Corynebacterium mendelii TaxID=2765362 RepID=A0A939E2E1_9CORY|nr:YibE/F family protein [Corynebacterium mendelii]